MTMAKVRDFLFVYIWNTIALTYLPFFRTGYGIVCLIFINILMFAELSIKRGRTKNDSNRNS